MLLATSAGLSADCRDSPVPGSILLGSPLGGSSTLTVGSNRKTLTYTFTLIISPTSDGLTHSQQVGLTFRQHKTVRYVPAPGSSGLRRRLAALRACKFVEFLVYAWRMFTGAVTSRGNPMSISRRNLLRNIGIGAVVEAAASAFRDLPLALATESAPSSNSQSAAQPVVGAPAAGPILLDRNENPFGPSEKVLSVLRESATSSNRYPRTEYDALTDKLAALHHVKREQIVLGCGSGEILCMAALTFLKPGKKLVQAAPTFPALRKLAQNAGVQVADVPLNKRYEHDLGAMLDHARSFTGLVYIVNANNPTGTITPRKDIEAFISKLPSNVWLLIDEAYHHFVPSGMAYESFLDRPVDDPRIIVVRTFSKIYGLAGMRVGYAVATPEVAKRLAASSPRWSVSVVSARAASAALDDVDYVRLGVKRNTDDRQEFMNQVNARMLRAIDSQTNFVMVNAMRPPDKVIEHLKKNNILIGPKYPLLDKYIRVSLGTPGEMQAFWRVLDLMPPIGKMAM
jgi:histidinol-phosphate aminotransferase